MKCPECGADSSVTETRPYEEYFLRRTRLCFNGHRFKTLEIFPGNLRGHTVERSKRGIAVRAKAWLLKLRVKQSDAPSAVLAKEHGVTTEWINFLRKQE